jgi:hypothetical protein
MPIVSALSIGKDVVFKAVRGHVHVHRHYDKK